MLLLIKQKKLCHSDTYDIYYSRDHLKLNRMFPSLATFLSHMHIFFLSFLSLII